MYFEHDGIPSYCTRHISQFKLTVWCAGKWNGHAKISGSHSIKLLFTSLDEEWGYEQNLISEINFLLQF